MQSQPGPRSTVVLNPSLAGFPVGLDGVPLGVPGVDGGGEPGAVLGVAFLVVGWAVAYALVVDNVGARLAGPGERLAVISCGLRVGSDGVAVGGVGNVLVDVTCHEA